MEKYETGSADAIIQRMNEFLVPKYFGAVELDSSSSPKLAKLYSDAEKTTLVMQIPIDIDGTSNIRLKVYGALGTPVASVSGKYSISSAEFFHVSEKAVIVASYGSPGLLSWSTTPIWLFAKDAKNNTVAIVITGNSSDGFGVFLPGKQIINSYTQTFVNNPANLINSFCTILIPAFSLDTGYAENIEGLYFLSATNNFTRLGVGTLSLNGVIYDVLGPWAIPRTT